jgi:hypothetical protein
MCCDNKLVTAIMGACTFGYGLVSGIIYFDNKTETKNYCDERDLDKKDFKRLKKAHKKESKTPFSVTRENYFYKEVDDIYKEKGYL